MTDFTNLFADVLKGVEPSAELNRILNLPQRDPEELGTKIAPVLTAKLRLRPNETPPARVPAALRWYQALALAEAATYRGALIPLGVGLGKTVVSWLLPVVLGAQRPVLLVPAKLREKTERDFAVLREWWRGVPAVQIISYELVSRRKDLLLQLGPDAIIADEAHRLKNPRSGVKRRVWRYMSHYPETPFIPMTGTLQSKSFLDWHHIQRGALPAPLHVLPDNWDEMVEWDQALGPNKKQRRPLGALSRLAGSGGGDHETVRRAFGERFRRTPGVITCPGGSCDVSLVFELQRKRHPEIEAALKRLDDTWETPNGVPFEEASQLWAHQREVANGYELIWREPGPPEWMARRRAANAFVRETLKHSRTCDTPLEVYRKFPAQPELVQWREIRDTFVPEPIATWYTYDVIDDAVQFARKHNALLWIEHVAAGEMIRERHGIPYFGRGAHCGVFGSIMDWKGGPCAVSVRSVGEGQNLQDRWAKNLILNITPGTTAYEQVLGRTHRQGQEADAVEAVQWWFSGTQRDGFYKALEQARAAQDSDGQAKKLVLADVVET